MMFEQQENEFDFWDELPESVKNEVEESIIAADKGLGKPHEEVMKKYL
ncbi:MAG: hypothetical protein V5804_11715 [Mucilaginibacter sp.]